MKIQQHDGVVVDAGRHHSRASPLYCERERCSRGEGGAKTQGCDCPLPPLYRPPRGCAGPRRWDLLGGAAAKGWSAPQARWGRPPP